MSNCRNYPSKKCPKTSPKPPSSDEADEDDTTVTALAVVVVIFILLFVVVFGIIIYRRMRTQNTKTTLEQSVQMEDQCGNNERGNTKYTNERNSEGNIQDHTVRLYSTILGDDKVEENIYNTIDECATTQCHDYEQANITEGQLNLGTKGRISIDHTYNKLNHITNDENSTDYSHAKVVDSPQEGNTDTLGDDNAGYDRLCNRPKKSVVHDSGADYDHMDNGETLSSSL